MFDVYQQWQRELERQPVEFLGRRVGGLLDAAREPLAAYLNCPVDDLVFVPNATSGVNVAVRSLDLQPGDEILTTQHEYGACTYTWQHACARSGARLVEQAIPLPYTTPEAFVEAFWQGVTPRTRVIYLSHVTSPTALIFPVAEICTRARAAGIITVIDGAHAPGQIPLDLTQIGADFYTGNCHKWMCTPKGSAFLYVRPERQAQTESVIVSWGWGEDATFISRNQRQGTQDPAAYLSVPAGIDFLAAHEWDSVRTRCHDLGVELREQIAELTGCEPIAPDSWFAQMFAAPLPPCDPEAMKLKLYNDYRIEVPVLTWGDRQYVRVSLQGYNTREDGQRLLEALRELLV